jgi:hypothetical protein
MKNQLWVVECREEGEVSWILSQVSVATFRMPAVVYSRKQARLLKKELSTIFDTFEFRVAKFRGW